MTNLNDLTKDELIALVGKMQAQPARKITMKVTAPKLDEKTGEMKGSTGALAVYGLGRFPITLYRSQWETLFTAVNDIKAFIKQNEDILATKD